jgi:hypothetical protein
MYKFQFSESDVYTLINALDAAIDHYGVCANTMRKDGQDRLVEQFDRQIKEAQDFKQTLIKALEMY